MQATRPERVRYLLRSKALETWFPDVTTRKHLSAVLRSCGILKPGRRPDTSTRQIYIAPLKEESVLLRAAAEAVSKIIFSRPNAPECCVTCCWRCKTRQQVCAVCGTECSRQLSSRKALIYTLMPVVMDKLLAEYAGQAFEGGRLRRFVDCHGRIHGRRYQGSDDAWLGDAVDLVGRWMKTTAPSGVGWRGRRHSLLSRRAHQRNCVSMANKLGQLRIVPKPQCEHVAVATDHNGFPPPPLEVFLSDDEMARRDLVPGPG